MNATNIELHPQAAEVAPRTSLEEFETWLGLLLEAQRDVLWQIGDLALAVERQHPSTYHQAYPVWASPDLIARCKAVSAAYKPDERNINATWSIHKNHCKAPDRVALVEAAVEAGQTSDENRRDPAPVVPETPPVVEEAPAVTLETAPPAAEPEPTQTPGWLLAVDLNYYVQRSYPKDGVETAANVTSWLQRLIVRLQEKGLTDVVVCFDSKTNHRRALTEGWEQPYKERTKKDPELVAQLMMIRDLIQKLNLACVEIDDMEADDVMASYAKQFQGKVTLMTADKDLRQCLSPTCNILRDMKWEPHPETNQLQQIYDWVSAKAHVTEGSNYSGTKVAGITPELWPHFQAIAGDSTDDIRGCEGIGGKGAMDLILAHGTVHNVIEACRTGQAALSAKKVEAVLAFAPFAETMLKLTTLRTDLQVPMITKLAMKEPSNGE